LKPAVELLHPDQKVVERQHDALDTRHLGQFVKHPRDGSSSACASRQAMASRSVPATQWFHFANAASPVSSGMMMVDTSAPQDRPVSAVALTNRATLSVTAVRVDAKGKNHP
jgi:hypothetical protein